MLILLIFVILALIALHALTERSPENGQASDRRYDYMR